MTEMEAVRARHSVRSYLDRPIPADTIAALQREIAACNEEGGLHIQLVTGETDAFSGAMAHYGSFSGVSNYIALVGKKGKDLDEKLGYYGERIALCAQMLGLNTCWVALSFSKSAAKRNITVKTGEKMVLVLSLGYGATQGKAHVFKPLSRVFPAADTAPAWARPVAEAALLAPTAVNQQQFRLTVTGDRLTAVNLGGFYSKVDLGIVKYHIDVALRERAEA